jgi:hypothetical protein
MNREPEDLPDLSTHQIPVVKGERNARYWALNTKGPHVASAYADLFLCVNQFQTFWLNTYTGGHNLIGKAVYEAVIEALGKQNGFKKGTAK